MICRKFDTFFKNCFKKQFGSSRDKRFSDVPNIVYLLLTLESFQDFLIQLDMKPRMHLVEISIFSLNLVMVRLTKIMNRSDKNWAQF